MNNTEDDISPDYTFKHRNMIPLQMKRKIILFVCIFTLPYHYWALQSMCKFLISSLHVLDCVLLTELLWSTCHVNKNSGYIKTLDLEQSFNYRVIPTGNHLQPQYTRYEFKNFQLERRNYLFYSNLHISTLLDNYRKDQDSHLKMYNCCVSKNSCPILNKDLLHRGRRDLLDTLYTLNIFPYVAMKFRALAKISNIIQTYTPPTKIRSDILDCTSIFPFIDIKYSKCNIKVYMSISTKCLM